MHELYELKEKLMDELKEYGKQEMSAGSLDVIDKLAHAVKNICKVIEADEDEYSQRGSYRGAERYSRNMGGSYRGGYDGNSYARGRGSGARRDSMGRYSRGGSPDDMIEQLEQLMQEAPNEQIKQQIRQLVQQIEQM